ncbi:MAG: carboxypeptidase regulatory-like domain-containing protein, partial [Planctomycetes bacterium]|nr:carboxypeptidase regulatory-like domain-containing protein [Planctomycetota bacterium]
PTFPDRLAKRKYLVIAAPGRLTARLTVPKINFTATKQWKEAKTEELKLAEVGLDRLARMWGRAIARPRGGVDFGKVVLGQGRLLRGRVVDDRGKPVEGAKVRASDLMVQGRFSGVSRRGKAQHTSLDVTGKDGAFELPGTVSTGSVITASADGFMQIEQHVIEPTESLELRLTRGGEISGRVFRSNGLPATGSVRIAYEVATSTYSESIADDGRFKFNLRFPHRYRLTFQPGGTSAKDSLVTYSELLTGPREGLEVTLPAKKVPKKVAVKKPKPKPKVVIGFPVVIVDKATRHPISGFKAAAVWSYPYYAKNDGYMERSGKAQGKTSKQPGYIRLRGPTSSYTPHGAIVVTAKGYANYVQMGLNWEEDQHPSVVVEMVPESRITGTVHDKLTGEPVPGARITVSREPVSDSYSSVSATADKHGRFTVDSLRRGKYRVYAAHNRRPGASETVEVGDEDCRFVTLHIGHGATVSGRIEGIEIQKGWSAELLRDNQYNYGYYYYSSSYRPSGTRTKLLKDGSFEFEDVAAGYYEVCVRIPAVDKWSGDDMLIPLEPIRVRKRDVEVIADASQDRPGRIRGKVELTGAKLDLSRLMVVISKETTRYPYYYYSYRSNIDLSGARAQLGPDGRFDLPVEKGKHEIKVVDLLTGVQLFRSKYSIEVDSGATVEQKLEVPLAEVAVEIKSKAEGGSVAATWLNIEVEEPQEEALRMFVFWGGSSYRRPTGLSLRDYRGGKLRLVLPPYLTRFQVHSDARGLSRAREKPESQIGDAELKLESGKVNEVTVEIEVPVNGFDPEPKPGEEADAQGKEAKKGAASAKAAAPKKGAANKDSTKGERAKKATTKKATTKKASTKKDSGKSTKGATEKADAKPAGDKKDAGKSSDGRDEPVLPLRATATLGGNA